MDKKLGLREGGGNEGVGWGYILYGVRQIQNPAGFRLSLQAG